MDTIVFAAALEAGESYLYPYLRQRYIIILHLQVPLRIGTGTSQRQNRMFFYDMEVVLEEGELLCTVISGTGSGGQSYSYSVTKLHN
jgi:hypothetical protein